MAVEFVTTGRIEAGALRIRNKREMKQALSHWRDGDVTVTVERKHATRSLPQNAWYWGVIVELISEHTGYTPDEVHDVLKAKFIPKKLAICDSNGEVKDELVIGGTTTQLNKIQFGEYCEAIRQWAAEDLGVVIPDPSDAR